jgi:hypothetical protein
MEVIKSGNYRGKLCYGGLIYCVLGDISIDSMDKITDLMDEYIELLEAGNKEEDNAI